MLPIAQTAQKYQQETFLVMSLKKQIRELKYEVVHREEELEVLRKKMKITRHQELEQECALYRDECMRMRSLIEDLMRQGAEHPMHADNLGSQVQNCQEQLEAKDAQIGQLQQELSAVQSKLDQSFLSMNHQ